MLSRFVLTGLSLASLGLAQQQAIPKLTGVVYWPAAKLQTLATGLKTKEHPSRAGQRAASVYQQMGSHGRYSFLNGLRDGNTVPEAHAGIDDIFIVQEGEATLLYGGKVEGVAQVATGAMHGGHLVGAESVKLSPGDMVRWPPIRRRQMARDPDLPPFRRGRPLQKGSWIQKIHTAPGEGHGHVGKVNGSRYRPATILVKPWSRLAGQQPKARSTPLGRKAPGDPAKLGEVLVKIAGICSQGDHTGH